MRPNFSEFRSQELLPLGKSEGLGHLLHLLGVALVHQALPFPRLFHPPTDALGQHLLGLGGGEAGDGQVFVYTCSEEKKKNIGENKNIVMMNYQQGALQ